MISGRKSCGCVHVPASQLFCSLNERFFRKVVSEGPCMDTELAGAALRTQLDRFRPCIYVQVLTTVAHG